MRLHPVVVAHDPGADHTAITSDEEAVREACGAIVVGDPLIPVHVGISLPIRQRWYRHHGARTSTKTIDVHACHACRSGQAHSVRRESTGAATPAPLRRGGHASALDTDARQLSVLRTQGHRLPARSSTTAAGPSPPSPSPRNREPTAAVRAPEPQVDQRHVALAGVDQGLQVGIAPMAEEGVVHRRYAP